MAWLTLLRRKGATLRRLSPAERGVLLQAMGLLPLVAISLRILGLRLTQSVLAWLPRRQVAKGSDRVWMTVRMVKVAVRYQRPWANCLKRSLVLWALLRCQGIDSQLRIGVRQTAGEFAAHAWVDYDGVVLNDTQDVELEFSPFEHAFEAKA
jgi:hypothetical protein